jgi:glycosyltransferase involved in cell wall biosynthesis
MSYPLAVLSLNLGVPSETFIRRHVRDLLPGGTVVIAESGGPANGRHWHTNYPAFFLESVRKPRFRQQVVRAVAQRLGWRTPDEAQLSKRFLQRSRVKVILGEYLDQSLPWLSVAQDLGIPLFGHAHGYDVSLRLRDEHWRQEYQRYGAAGGVITINQTSRERLIGLGIDPAKVHVVPYGVDVPEQPLRRPGSVEVRCVAVGRMVAKKAPILLLDAFRRAADRVPGLRLNYVGGGPLLSAAAQYIHAFRLAGRVTLHGVAPNEVVQRLMREAHVFLQHSMTDPDTGDEEGLPVAILEAMAHALPVVSTRHAGIPEAVQDGATGLLADEGDCEGMADRLATLARDPESRSRMGVAGWERAREYFSWEKERRALLRILGLASGSVSEGCQKHHSMNA